MAEKLEPAFDSASRKRGLLGRDGLPPGHALIIAPSNMLVLRNPLDVVPTETSGVRLTSLMGTPDAPPVVKVKDGQARVVPKKPVVVEAPQEQKFYSIEAIRAQKRSEEVVKDKDDAVKKDDEKKDKEGVIK